jgi:hypothetical protein
LLAQQGADLHSGVIDLDLKIWMSRLQLSAGGFGSVGGVKLRLEMAVDNRREPFGRWPVGSCCFLRFGSSIERRGFFIVIPSANRRDYFF